MKVCFVTLGCAKNEVDSNRMQALVTAAGFEVVPEPEQARAIVVNTCSFITEATEESIATILEVLDLEHVKATDTNVIVTGCMPSRYGAELAAEFPEVKAFIPCKEEDTIVEVLTTLEPVGAVLTAREPLRTTNEPWAYLKIADGCSRKCSFCTIPAIRGPYKSRPATEIIAEADALVAQGAHELILIAQDTGLWHDDTGTSQDDLSALLHTLATRHPQVWLRVMYLQPGGVTPRLLTTMAAHANICDYLDIPLQHANATILRSMNRAGNGAEYLGLIGSIREALPDAAVRTTVIAGYPGESDEQAGELEDFIAAAGFDFAGVFAYSQEDGTPAGELEGQLDEDTKIERCQRLRDIADAAGWQRAARFIDTEQDVLICGYEDGHPFGRTRYQAPEVDGVVLLDRGTPGELVRARINEVAGYDLYGEVL
jgi:ribosomal protein S12 methylthiotransferase